MNFLCRTPEYMSPELLHNGQDGTDQAYDPRSTDVWAAGVMLVVALCGAFPFDHTQHHHRSMEEAEVDLWYSSSTPPACAGYPVLTDTPRSEVPGRLKTQVCIPMLILLLLCVLMHASICACIWCKGAHICASSCLPQPPPPNLLSRLA